MTFRQHKHLLPGILVLAAISLRWIFPEADPVWWLNIEDLHDEAWWAENARRKILFDTWMWDQYAGALASGPLAVFWHYLSFKAFGISFFSLRLIAIIPSTFILILIWIKSPFQNQNRNAALALLCGSSAFFAISRVGYLEVLLILILVLIVICLQTKRVTFAIFAGLLMTAGLLFKGSFIFILLPLICWIWISTEQKKMLFWTLSIFTVSSAVVLLLYFIPNQDLFLPYYEAFSGNYIPSGYLYDPRGWIARLIWLPEKAWASSPLACWMIIYFLLKINRGIIPSIKSSAFGLFILILAFALLSDFSDRRLVPLLFLLPFILFEKGDFCLNSVGKLFVGFVLLLPGLAWVSPIFPAGDLKMMIHTTFSISLILALGIIGSFWGIMKLLHIDISIWILRAGILIWSLAVLHYSAQKWMVFTHQNYLVLMAIALIIFLILVIVLLFPKEKKHLQKFVWMPLVAAQLLLLLINTVFPSYTLKKASKQIASLARYEERITGPNNAIELIFLSLGKTSMFPLKDTTHSFNLFIGYLSADNTVIDVSQFSEKIEEPRNELSYRLFPILHDSKSEAFIVYSKTVFEKN